MKDQELIELWQDAPGLKGQIDSMQRVDAPLGLKTRLLAIKEKPSQSSVRAMIAAFACIAILILIKTGRMMGHR